MGGKNSTRAGGSTPGNGNRQRSGSTQGQGPQRPGGRNNAPSSNMPQHLAEQYNNTNARQQRTGNANSTPADTTQPPTQPQQQQQQPQQQARSQPPQNTAPADRGVQEGQMVKMLATIEASTVSYTPATQVLTFFITSVCPSITYEIHTGVKEFVQGGNVFYMPNKPKMEPTRTAIESPHENRKITVKLDVSKLEEKEKVFNKHYPKQMPCVIVIRYRTTELRQKDGDENAANNGRGNSTIGGGEEIVVEHSEHTAVDLAVKPKRRVISQIVSAGGSAYVVENLYGADTDNAGASGEGGNEVTLGSTIVPHEGEEDEDGLCVICLTNPKDTAVMPCRHMCMCKECGEQLLKHKPVCPVCRAPISTLLHMPTLSQK